VFLLCTVLLKQDPLNLCIVKCVMQSDHVVTSYLFVFRTETPLPTKVGTKFRGQSGCRSVGIVRMRTKGHRVCFVHKINLYGTDWTRFFQRVNRLKNFGDTLCRTICQIFSSIRLLLKLTMFMFDVTRLHVALCFCNRTHLISVSSSA
jgi:hypothetical protein